MKYAVTAVTGHFGAQAIAALAQSVPRKDIVALARNVAKAQEIVPEGIEVRPGDYTVPGDLHNSLKGIDKLLFISSQPGDAMPRLQQHLNVVTAAKNAGVSFIAYTSFPHADVAETPLAEDHHNTERAIENTGIAHAFLRNNWYLENDLGLVRDAIAGRPFIYGAGDGKVGWAPEQAYALAAAKVLTLAEPKTHYEFAGTMHTYAELAAAGEAASGQSFEIVSASLADYQASLIQNGVSKETAVLLTLFQTLIANGALEESTTDLQTVLGAPLPDLVESIKATL